MPADDPTDPKPWYASRTVWLNVLLSVGGVALYFSLPEHTPTLTVPSIALAAAGVVNVILRVWFTAAPITGTPAAHDANLARLQRAAEARSVGYEYGREVVQTSAQRITEEQHG